MRTTIRLDDHVLAEAKQLAARTGRSLTRVIEDALRETLRRRKPPERRPRVRLPTVSGRGLLPGIDLDHTAALLDALEGPNGPR
jgi:hypothetical protein